MALRIPPALLFALALAAGPVHAQGFKFSNEDEAEKQQEAERQGKVQALLQTPCREKIRSQKITTSSRIGATCTRIPLGSRPAAPLAAPAACA